MANEKINGGSLDWDDKGFMILATKENQKAMKKAAIYTQGVARLLIGGVGAGRLYKRKNKQHRASLPGNPPARDTGVLANSVSYEVKKSGLSVSGYVGSNIDKIRSKKPTSDPEYGVYLEKGTPRMKARPWLRPALIKATPKIWAIFKDAMSKI